MIILNYEVKFLNTLPQKIISIREECKSEEISQKTGKNIEKVFNYIAQKRLYPRGPPVAIFYNVNKQKIDFEVGIPIEKPINVEGEFKLSSTPGGKAVFTLYKGHYEKIKPAYDAIENWIKEKGYEGTNIWWEIYCSNPQPNPNDWKTEIYCQLK